MAKLSILIPYMRRREPNAFSRYAWTAALLGVATFYALMIVILPLQLLIVPAVPIFIGAGLILWMLPDTDHVYDSKMDQLMCWFAATNVLWPGYIALNLPGVPWVTPMRIAVFMLVSLVLFNMATSVTLRHRLKEGLDGVPIIRRLFWGFWLLTTLSLFLSAEPAFSLNKYANNQIFWTMIFAVSAFLATTREGFALRIGRILVWSVIVVALLGIYEYIIKRVWWLDHISGFLKIDPDYLDRLMSSQARGGTDIYRAKSTFATALTFSEYLGLTFPLVIHYTARAKSFWRFALMLMGVAAMMVAMYLTNARSAMVGLLISAVAYTFFATCRAKTLKPNSLAATATLYAYPAAMALLAIVVELWPRAHVLVLGGANTAPSSLARDAQWTKGLGLLAHNPIGHGVGIAARTLNYTNGEGTLTIDTYYLSLLLEYGVIGFVCFLAMFILAGWFGFRAYLRTTSEELMLIAPLSIGLLNFIVIRSVISVEVNMPTAFMMLGLLVALIHRQRLQDKAA